MDLQECYAALGGSYEDAVGRFHGERLVKKFAMKFLADGSYDLLQSAWQAGEDEEAFRAAHTLKGVCQNLSYDRLYQSSAALTEALRGGRSPQAAQLLLQVQADYEATVAALKAYQAAEEEP